ALALRGRRGDGWSQQSSGEFGAAIALAVDDQDEAAEPEGRGNGHGESLQGNGGFPLPTVEGDGGEIGAGADFAGADQICAGGEFGEHVGDDAGVLGCAGVDGQAAIAHEGEQIVFDGEATVSDWFPGGVVVAE